MELQNEFKVPGPPDDVFATLLDLEQVAPCMPGAKLLEHDGDNYRGLLKIKVGPIAASYEGNVTIEEVDRMDRRAVLSAAGSETNGQGSAEAVITARVDGDGGGGGSVVRISTDLQIRGKVAQFGRGMLADVTQRVIDQFASNLEARLLTAPAEHPSAAAPMGQGRENGATQSGEETNDASLDALSLIVLPVLRRGAPYVLALLLGVLLGRLSGRRVKPASPQWPYIPPAPYMWPPAATSPADPQNPMFRTPA